MNKVQPFDFDGAQVRVIEAEGVTWFVANDVAKAMGYKNGRKSIQDHCKKAAQYRKVVKGVTNWVAGGSEIDIQTLLIPESDIYRLAMKSRLPTAKRFEKWVMEDVLPSIRATGKYEVGQNEQPRIPDFSNPAAAARAWADEYEQRQKTEQQLLIDKPYANLGKVVASPDNTMTRRDWCNMMKREHGVKVAERKLTQWLIDCEYCYRDQYTSELRAYAHHSHLLTLKFERINGALRPLLMVTGTGIKELTNRVLEDFADNA